MLKLHTKKSPHLVNGAEWRKEMVRSLVRSGSIAMSEFRRDSMLGLLGPDGHLLRLNSYMSSNAGKVQQLASDLGFQDAVTDDTLFVSGSMFWVRLEAIKPLLESRLHASDFERESGQLDGTLAHAIERLFGACVEASGYRIAPVGIATRRENVPYPYARRD